MSDTREFSRLYTNLNKAQKKAVDTIEGPVMVVAGPGTGKTTILTLRIANILLKTDVEPEQILALTFTESGVAAMRKKLHSIIGSSAYRVHIHTFHGFSNEIIMRFPDYFARIIGAHPATDIDKIRIIEEILDAGEYSILRPYGDTRYYVRPLLSAISSLKRDAVTPEMFNIIIRQEQKKFESQDDLYYESGMHVGKMKGKYTRQARYIEKNRELAAAYEAYERALANARLYDFDDMILEVITTMEADVEFKLMLQEEYQYILADEHQDANNSQNTLLELLSDFHDRPNLFIVGDEKQAIFRFQGASLENFLYFKDRYPDVELIALTNNYRSTQKILDSAHSLITSGADSPLHIPLESCRSLLEENIELSIYPQAQAEYDGLVSSIKVQIERGVPHNEIAVLFRDNKEGLLLVPYFERTKIPFTIVGDIALFSNEDILQCLKLLRAVASPNNDRLLIEMLFLTFFDISHIDIYRLTTYAQKNKLSFSEAFGDPKSITGAGLSDAEKLQAVSSQFTSWVKISRNKTLLEVLEIILRESGLINSLMMRTGSVARLELVSGLYREAEVVARSNEEASLADFIAYIDMLESYSIRPTVRPSENDGVRLMTAHKSKGLEFDCVHIIGLCDGRWGGRRSRNLFVSEDPRINLSSNTQNEDERRLFYVSLTRARQSISLSYATLDFDGKEKMPSQFLDEIDENIIDSVSFKHENKKENNVYGFRHNLNPSIDDYEYIQKQFVERGLSVTAINNYLSCPWKYFYQNLVRIPAPQNKFLLFGTAVHGALRYYFDAFKANKKVFPEDAYNYFIDILPEYMFSNTDYTELKMKGEKAIIGYLNSNNSWNKNITNELRVDGVLFDMVLDNKKVSIPLKGALDKVEITDEGVSVIDYKTGKPKSRNEIEGKTKTSNGEYKRQLVFYKLLLNDYKNGIHIMNQGEIHFVEPNEKNEYRKEVFEINDEELEILRKDIERISTEIYTVSFWANRCDDTGCEYCLLRNSIDTQK